MFNKILKIIFIIFCTIMVAYLALPNFSFPAPLPDSIKSQEPADMESSLRQGYFTNFTRMEALSWYESEFSRSGFGYIKIPTVLLNYPPENAQTLIRDQTNSTFLQEFVHPFRESEYINGFEPHTTSGEPVFFVDGKAWRQKIIVRYVPSNVIVREVVFILSAVMIMVIFNEFKKLFTRKNV